MSLQLTFSRLTRGPTATDEAFGVPMGARVKPEQVNKGECTTRAKGLQHEAYVRDLTLSLSKGERRATARLALTRAMWSLCRTGRIRGRAG
jgi:hypothetical protein